MIGATYNGAAQASTCTASVTMPTITASSNTPTIIGWSNASGTHSKTYTSGQTSVTLTSGTTWYAQTSQSLTATFYYYNSGIKNTSSRCSRYNGSSSCSVTVPLSTFNTTKSQYGGSYVGYGAVNSVGTSTASTVSVSGNTSYYVSYRQNVTEYYQNISRTIYRNSYFTSTTAMNTVLSTSNVGTRNLSGASWNGASWYGYGTSAGSRSYSSVSAAATSTATTLYTLYSKNISVTFYYVNSSNLAALSANSSGTQITNYAGSIVSNGSVSIPNSVTASGNSVIGTYYGVSTSKSSSSIVTPTTANSTYYTVYRGTFTANYTKGTNVSSIGATTNSCTHYTTYNGTSYSTSCKVTLPAIVANNDYYPTGWYTKTGTIKKFGDANSVATLTGNVALEARARQLTDSDLSYSNSVSGYKCTDVRCAINKLYYDIFNNGFDPGYDSSS